MDSPCSSTEGVSFIAYGDGSLWVVVGLDEVVWRIDPGPETVTTAIPRSIAGFPYVGQGIAVGEGAVWVNGPDNVTRIEPDTNSSATIDVRHRLGGIAAGEGGVWTADSREGVLWRIDPVREAPVRTINVGAGSLGVAAGAGSVWVANSIDGTVSRIDPVTSEVVKTIEVGGTPRGVAVGEGFVWVTVS